MSDYLGKEIVWEDPPAPKRGRTGKYDYVFDALKREPGKWARVNEYSTSNTAYSAAKYFRDKYPDYEIVARTDGTVSKVFARYVGEQTDPE